MGGIGSGKKKLPTRLVKDAIQDINIDNIFLQLQEWAKGHSVICPYCNKDTGAYTADTVALQSAIELLNRKLGKPAQKLELDITETLQLTGDQCDRILNRILFSPEAIEYFKLHLLPAGDIIEGEFKEI